MTDPPPFSSHWVCRLRADLGTMPEIGTLAAGRRRVVPIAGGTVAARSCAARSSRAAPTGSSSPPTARPRSRPATRCAPTTARLLPVHSRGVRSGDPEALARLAAGEAVDADAYCFRRLVTLETSAGALHGSTAACSSRSRRASRRT